MPERGDLAEPVLFPHDGAGAPASSRTRNESCLLVGSMIRASTSCLNTSSLPVACGNPRAS